MIASRGTFAATPPGVPAAIAAHMAAVHADEASFTEGGRALDAAMASVTGKAEAEAFAVFIREPCASAADVQAKVDYVLNGTIGEREPLLSGVLGEDGCDILAVEGALCVFLRSLIGEATPAIEPDPSS